jgi:hypothetical protein
MRQKATAGSVRSRKMAMSVHRTKRMPAVNLAIESHSDEMYHKLHYNFCAGSEGASCGGMTIEVAMPFQHDCRRSSAPVTAWF